MIGLLLFVSIIVLGLYALHEYYKTTLGYAPQKTSKGAIEAFANMIEDTNTDEGRLLQLGSGYGEFVLGAARRLPGWDIIGVEQSPTPWIITNLRTIGKNMTNYRFYLSDISLWPLKNYDIIFINHNEETLKKWEQSLVRRLPAGVLLITMNAKLPRVASSNTIVVDHTTTFHIYEKRATAAVPTPEQIAEQVAVETVAAAGAPPATTVAPQQPIPAALGAGAPPA